MKLKTKDRILTLVILIVAMLLVWAMVDIIALESLERRSYKYKIEYGIKVYYTDSIEHVKTRLEFERDGISYSIPERGAVVIRQRKTKE